MVKIKRKGFGFTLEVVGEVQVDKNKILPYPEYVKQEEDKQIKEQVFNYLCSLVPSVTPPESEFLFQYTSSYEIKKGLKELAEYLVNNMEAE